MDAIDRGLLREQQPLRDGLVGGQHELLDQAVGDVARLRDDADHESGVVENDVRVRQVEVDGASRIAPLPKQRRELAHVAEVLEKRAVAVFVGRRRAALEEPRDLRVCHALRAADHALHELGVQHPSLAVGLEQGGQDEPVHAGVQRAETVREPLRKHRQHAPREVHARPA